MIYVKATGRVLKLSQCGIAVENRFAFYDQIHTTGMDIKHTLSARAAITIGKDMVFRDLAQGAYRMRGIAQGQTITMLIIPEVGLGAGVGVGVGVGLPSRCWSSRRSHS